MQLARATLWCTALWFSAAVSFSCTLEYCVKYSLSCSLYGFSCTKYDPSYAVAVIVHAHVHAHVHVGRNSYGGAY